MKKKTLLIVVILLLASCDSMSKTTLMPESQQLSRAAGEVNPCLLWDLDTLERDLHIKIDREATDIEGAVACRYFSKVNNQNILLAVIYTDTSLQTANKPYKAVDWFEQSKQLNLQSASAAKTNMIEQLPQFGEKAYYVEGTMFLELHFLKNKNEYVVLTPKNEKSGLKFDSLVNMAGIAYQQAP